LEVKILSASLLKRTCRVKRCIPRYLLAVL